MGCAGAGAGGAGDGVLRGLVKTASELQLMSIWQRRVAAAGVCADGGARCAGGVEVVFEEDEDEQGLAEGGVRVIVIGEAC